MNILKEPKPVEMYDMFGEKSLNSKGELFRWIASVPTVASPLAISIEDRFIILAPLNALNHSQGDSQVIILEVHQVINFSNSSTGMNAASALISTEIFFLFPSGIIFESPSTAGVILMLSSTKFFRILFATSSYSSFFSTTNYSSISTVDSDNETESLGLYYQISVFIWVGLFVFHFLFVL